MHNIPSNLKRIIKLLNDGNYHTGSSIGEKLNITRSAVWKFVKQLQNNGIEIVSEHSQGYCLTQPLILLDERVIKKYLSDDASKVAIEIFNSIDSTSDYFKYKKFEYAETIPVCIAEEMTAGRGRLGRTWYSPFGKNIYLSCLWHFSKEISELSGLGLVVGLAVIKALTKLGISDLNIKWPNDILWKGKKLGGILIDVSAETHGYSQAIIGIGINVNMSEAPAHEINQPWTSLLTITDKPLDRNRIIAEIINQALLYITQFTKHGLKHFQTEWQHYDLLLNKEIQLEHLNSAVSGTVDGINDQGHLLLRHTDGSIKAYASGDTSIPK